MHPAPETLTPRQLEFLHAPLMAAARRKLALETQAQAIAAMTGMGGKGASKALDRFTKTLLAPDKIIALNAPRDEPGEPFEVEDDPEVDAALDRLLAERLGREIPIS